MDVHKQAYCFSILLGSIHFFGKFGFLAGCGVLGNNTGLSCFIE